MVFSDNEIAILSALNPKFWQQEEALYSRVSKSFGYDFSEIGSFAKPLINSLISRGFIEKTYLVENPSLSKSDLDLPITYYKLTRYL